MRLLFKKKKKTQSLTCNDGRKKSDCFCKRNLENTRKVRLGSAWYVHFVHNVQNCETIHCSVSRKLRRRMRCNKKRQDAKSGKKGATYEVENMQNGNRFTCGNKKLFRSLKLLKLPWESFHLYKTMQNYATHDHTKKCEAQREHVLFERKNIYTSKHERVREACSAQHTVAKHASKHAMPEEVV